MKILVVTGASGGHIYPALAFLESLKEAHCPADTLFVLPSRSIKTDLSSAGCRVEYISSAQLRFALSFENIRAGLQLMRGAGESLRILLRFKPDLVVGFGSIDSIPLVMLAWFFRIKTLIHEQNVRPGRANAFLAKFADKVAVSFPQAAGYFNISGAKIVLTGNPLRKSLKKIDKKEALGFFGLPENKFTLLVMGGSQGSRHINAAFLKAAKLSGKAVDWQVIHLIGRGDLRPAQDAYRDMGITAKVFDLFGAMEFAYSAADLAVCRAGAATISELIYFRLPAIISPYPYAYAHQAANARVLEERGCALVINDEDLESGLFAQALESLIGHGERLNKMVLGFAGFPDSCAAERLRAQALSLN